MAASPPERSRLRRWLARRGAVVALLLGTGLAYRTVFVYQLHPNPCPAARGGGGSQVLPAGARLTVMSYNIEGHAALLDEDHLSEVARVIVARRPDVVALQEVHRGTWQARFRDQAAELATRTGMRVVFGPSFRVLGGEFGNAILTPYRVVASRVVPLPSFGEPRSLLVTTVEVRGATFDVYTTHLAAWGSANRRIRARQVRCLREQLRAAGRPFVLSGDLNAGPGTIELHELEQGGFVRLCGVATEPTHTVLSRRLDYIFADPRFAVLEAAVIHEGPSDHWPIAATLAWQGTLAR